MKRFGFVIEDVTKLTSLPKWKWKIPNCLENMTYSTTSFWHICKSSLAFIWNWSINCEKRKVTRELQTKFGIKVICYQIKKQENKIKYKWFVLSSGTIQVHNKMKIFLLSVKEKTPLNSTQVTTELYLILIVSDFLKTKLPTQVGHASTYSPWIKINKQLYHHHIKIDFCFSLFLGGERGRVAGVPKVQNILNCQPNIQFQICFWILPLPSWREVQE